MTCSGCPSAASPPACRDRASARIAERVTSRNHLTTILASWPHILPIGGLVLLAIQVVAPVPALLTIALVAALVLAAVHQAEIVALKVGEPFGSLILALAVTVIEVGLIVSLMLANPEATLTLARDTVFAAAMIILNLMLGACFIAMAQHQQRAIDTRFTRTGATAALGTLAVLLVLALVLPNYTISESGPVYSAGQLAFVAIFSLILYLMFVFVQTVRNRDYFLPRGDQRSAPNVHADPPSDRLAWLAFTLLLISLFAIVFLAKSLSPALSAAVDEAGLPRALVGIAIAGIVLLPEGLAAVRAARSNRFQTSLNLALGSALATIGLTIPAVALVTFSLGLPLSLGLDPKGITLLALTIFVASLSLARGRTTLLHGAIHLTLFAAYLMVTVLP